MFQCPICKNMANETGLCTGRRWKRHGAYKMKPYQNTEQVTRTPCKSCVTKDWQIGQLKQEMKSVKQRVQVQQVLAALRVANADPHITENEANARCMFYLKSVFKEEL